MIESAFSPGRCPGPRGLRWCDPAGSARFAAVPEQRFETSTVGLALARSSSPARAPGEVDSSTRDDRCPAYAPSRTTASRSDRRGDSVALAPPRAEVDRCARRSRFAEEMEAPSSARESRFNPIPSRKRAFAPWGFQGTGGGGVGSEGSRRAAASAPTSKCCGVGTCGRSSKAILNELRSRQGTARLDRVFEWSMRAASTAGYRPTPAAGVPPHASKAQRRGSARPPRRRRTQGVRGRAPARILP